MSFVKLSLVLLATLAVPGWAAPARKPAARPDPKPAAKPGASKPVAPKPAALKPTADPDAAEVISEGKEAVLVDHLRAESVTVVLFYLTTEPEQAELADALRKRSALESRIAFKTVKLTSADAPIAKQYEAQELPTAFIYDRNKNLIGRARTFTQVGEHVMQGLKVARIKWGDDSHPNAAEIYRRFGGGQRRVPEIMKTMSLRPEIMEAINDLSRFHFSDGFINRRTKEMIASYVSALNKCKY
jgi:hypothetical protein